MGAELLALAIENAPAIIRAFKENFVKQNPDAPVPTDDEVAAAFQQAFASSIAKDEAWLTAHPEIA